MRRRLIYWLEEYWQANQAIVDDLARYSFFAAVALVAQLVFWSWAPATNITRDDRTIVIAITITITVARASPAASSAGRGWAPRDPWRSRASHEIGIHSRAERDAMARSPGLY